MTCNGWVTIMIVNNSLVVLLVPIIWKPWRFRSSFGMEGGGVQQRPSTSQPFTVYDVIVVILIFCTLLTCACGDIQYTLFTVLHKAPCVCCLDRRGSHKFIHDQRAQASITKRYLFGMTCRIIKLCTKAMLLRNDFTCSYYNHK